LESQEKLAADQHPTVTLDSKDQHIHIHDTFISTTHVHKHDMFISLLWSVWAGLSRSDVILVAFVCL